jgi:cell wall-associated NlpC family hydrolase
MKKAIAIVAMVITAIVVTPVALLVVVVAPAITVSPVTCQITGRVGALSARQSAIVADIASRAELSNLGDSAVRVGVQASLALTGLINEPATGTGVGIFDFAPKGQWGPLALLTNAQEDALLFMTALDRNQKWLTQSPAVAASEVMAVGGTSGTATPARFALVSKEASTITNDVVAMASAQNSCGAAAPVTLVGVGNGGLPSGYQIPAGLSAQRTTVVEAAIAQIGKKYVWGAADPAVGFDCSGLVMWAWQQASPSVALDHYTVSQWQQTVPLTSLVGALPGDLVLVPGSDGSLNPPNPQHVAMYIGDINGVPWVVAAADQQLGIIAQTYSSLISGGLIAVGHIPTSDPSNGGL